MKCCAEVCTHKDSYTGIRGSPQVFRVGQCTKKARVILVAQDGSKHTFCTTHARMALEGFIGPGGTSESPNSRADIRRYNMDPPHKGYWKEA